MEGLSAGDLPTRSEASCATFRPQKDLTLLFSTVISAHDEISAGSDRVVGVHFVAYGGSILDYYGDAIVNAANTGGVSGFGVDEMINRAGGPRMREARRQFNGIPIGGAKVSPSFEHSRVKMVIHAVGPVFRETSLAKETPQAKDAQLASAYKRAFQQALEHGCVSVGFCLLSAGVFRGQRLVREVIDVGVVALQQAIIEAVSMTQASRDITPGCSCGSGAECFDKYETHLPLGPMREVAMVAYSVEEQDALLSSCTKLLGAARIPSLMVERRVMSPNSAH